MAANDRIGSEHNDERLFHSISIALHKEQKKNNRVEGGEKEVV